MTAEIPPGPLDQSVSALHQALEASEGRRDTANAAYVLATNILKNEGKYQFVGSSPREVGSYDEEPGDTTHYSRGIRFVETPPIEVSVAGATYNIFLRETREQNMSDRWSHRSQDKPGISMLASAEDDSKRARLLFSFEEERTVGHEGTPLDTSGTEQALETLRDFYTRLEEKVDAEKPTTAVSN